ncbi:MAG TPA: hypothetical protein VKT77_08680 [Chthonomonadaceae bacterium]|nr:hypothetical protein [Chthonomonadaceae bacterium]
MDDWRGSVRTIEEARDFVLALGCCGILKDKSGAPTLWDAIDAPDKQPGESGWGEKMGYVWSWKNELPARYPGEIFYGKRKGGMAVLCSMEALRGLYAAQHRPLASLSETARKLFAIIEQNPVTNGELKHLTNMTGKASRSAYDRALLELQVAFQIVRVNSTEAEGDTWTTFAAQYPHFNP